MQKIRFESADGLRGIACLGVVISHFLCSFYPVFVKGNFPTVFGHINSNISEIEKLFLFPMFNAIYNGHFSVIVFFLLSGYVLTIPFFTKADNYKAILIKRLVFRYLRLNGPVFFIILLSFGLYSNHLYFHHQVASMLGSAWLSKMFISDGTFSQAISQGLWDAIFFGKNGLNPVLWTLRIEFVGSIFLLITYIVTPEKYILLTSSLVCLILILSLNKTGIYCSVLFLGAYMQRFRLQSQYITLFFWLGLYLGGFQYHSIYFNYINYHASFDWMLLFHLLGALMLVSSVSQCAYKIIFLEKNVVNLGRYSFSIYLVHPLILGSIIYGVYYKYDFIFGNEWLLLIPLIILSYFFGKVYFNFVDNFIINFINKLMCQSYIFRKVKK